MMMTGRVLLVCALCVLWCVTPGGRCDDGKMAGSGSGGGRPPESKELEKSPEGPQGLQGGVPGVKENVTPAFPTPTEEEDDYEEADSDDDEDGETEEGEGKRRTAGQSNKEGTVLPDSGSREENLIGSRQEKDPAIPSTQGISYSDSREPNANPTQTEVEGKKDADKRPPSAENPLTTVNGENTLLGGIAGGNLPSPSEDSVDSRKQDGEDTTSEGKKNVPSPETAATPQSHRDEGSEGTGEDRKATTVTANTTDTTSTQSSDSSTVKMSEAAPQTAITTTAAQTNHTVTSADSDGSTAVSHTTSPLLILLVACAAAAAVVAA
ncbi:Mucin-associated surface protein (MASP) [Trypanosoma cruzi]|uniref:Mucin-associated surface protein (MASP) n=1 Tax=Trypanosoma cruzi TaxID=5693 RepID=A0A2V2W432_TRYCR|nr:Mucin-associated surface protein (MASP) [Trypanosoma cruzi]